MDVHIQSREGAEQLGSAALLVALDRSAGGPSSV